MCHITFLISDKFQTPLNRQWTDNKYRIAGNVQGADLYFQEFHGYKTVATSEIAGGYCS